MKPPARTFALAWLAAGTIVACSSRSQNGFPLIVDAGSDAATASSADAGTYGNEADIESGADAEGLPDTGVGAEAGTDASANLDAGSTPDAPVDAADGGAGAVVFGTSCTAPSVYADPFATNPLDAGWQIVVGDATYEATDAGTGLLALAEGNTNTQVWIGPRPAWTDYTISVPVRIDTTLADGNGGINFRMESVGTANNAGQMYYAGIAATDVIVGVENGDWTQYASAAGTFTTGVFYTLTVSVTGDSLIVSASATGGVTATVSYTDADAGADADFPTGSFGFRTYDMGMSYGPVTVTCN